MGTLAVRVEAQVQRGVGLRIDIDQADALARGGQRGAEVHGGGRFADAAFLIDDGDGSHSAAEYRKRRAAPPGQTS